VSAGSISQRNFPVPSRKKRSSSRKLPLEEIDIIQTTKRFGYSDREIAKMLNRSLGVVAKYTRGMKPDRLSWLSSLFCRHSMSTRQPPLFQKEFNPVTEDLNGNRPCPPKSRLHGQS